MTGVQTCALPILLNVPDPNNPGSTVLATTPTVFIAAGSTTATFTVRTVSDANPLNDDDETVTIAVLDGGTDYAVGVTGSATLNIRDLDNQGEISITPIDANAVEGGGTAGFSITRTGYNLGQVVIPFTLDGSASLADYTIAVMSGNGSINLANRRITLNALGTPPAEGSTQTVTFELTAIADGIVDAISGNGTETVNLTLTDSETGLYTLGASTETGDITIEDVDSLNLPTVSVAATVASVDENETNTADYGQFTITRTDGNADNFPLTVSYIISGTATGGTGGDYDNTILSTGTVTIGAGETSATITVAPLDDSVADGNKTVILTLTSPVNQSPEYVLSNNNSAAVTIIDDESAPGTIPQVSVRSSTNPNASEQDVLNPSDQDIAIFTFERSNVNANSALTVNFTVNTSSTATAGTDYINNLGTSITFNPGELIKEVTLTAIDDADLEGPETVTLSLSSDAAYTLGAARNATVTIDDADLEGPETVTLSLSSDAAYTLGAARNAPLS